MDDQLRFAFSVVQRPDGSLALIRDGQLLVSPVFPVLAFPFSSPGEGIALVDEYGKEYCWLDHVEQLDPESAHLLVQHIAIREFRPVINRIVGVSSYATPSNWTVQTNRGASKFELPSEESIRRLGGGRLVLTHSNGMQYLIQDLFKLDARSRQILARFMA